MVSFSTSVAVTLLASFVVVAAAGQKGQFVGSPQSHVCADSHGLDFSRATLVQNNLGGMGPDTGPAEIRLTNVTEVGGKSVDCVITNSSKYDPPRTWRNKQKGALISLGVAVGTSVALNFRLVDHESRRPVVLDRFYVSAFDLDTARAGRAAEWIRSDSLQAYYTTNSSEVRVRRGGRNRHTFRGTRHGVGSDNPRGPFGLTHTQADRTVALLFAHRAEFSLTFGATGRSRSGGWRVIVLGGKSSVTCAATAGGQLSQSSFDATYIISWPGAYYLTEDITFEPQPSKTSEVRRDLLPKPGSEKYPQLGGYFLGFFAAIVIQAPGVTFDCQGHSIGMSQEFHKRQRFFSIFELGSKPFASAAGPPQFSNGLLSPSEPYSAYNVTIQNCRLGLSSHHGIHGNNNYGVVLRNLQILSFEVGGIHLNGASNVLMEGIDVGPSLGSTFAAELSQAIFLDHLMNTLLRRNSSLFQARKLANITLRGRTVTIHRVLSRFRHHLNKYLDTGSGKLAHIFNSGVPGSKLPDGSAVYGILLHKTGPAVNEFGACGALETLNTGDHSEQAVLRDIKIHDLAVRPDQWTRSVVEGKQVMGPAGDVFRLTRALKNGTSRYRGNLFMDAQLAVGAFKKHAMAEGISPEETAYYFGGVHIPDQVLQWASNVWSDGEQYQWIQQLVDNSAFQCFGDAMSHVNKGAVGLRMAHVYNASLINVNISDISNSGMDDADPFFCKGVDPRYGGKDVYGAVIENSDVKYDDSTEIAGGLRIDTATLVSEHGGRVAGIHHVNTRRLQLDTDMNPSEVPITIGTPHAPSSYVMV